MSGSFIISTESLGSYTFEVWLIDSSGNSSNRLSGTIEVILDDRGLQWTPQASGSNEHLNGIVWGNSQLVVVGNNGTILTSPDAITWTPRFSGTSNNLWNITWSGTQYIAVGELGTILSSPDGETWTGENSGITGCNLYDIAYSGSLYVAVGGEFDFGPNDNDTLLLTSQDGYTWTKIISPVILNHKLHGITWSGSQFIAVSISELSPSDAIILSSVDGINWNQISIGRYSLFDIIWTGSQFIIVGSAGYAHLSSDGLNWQTYNTGSLNLWGIASSGNTNVAVGISNSVVTSTDGISWTSHLSRTSEYLKEIIWDGTEFVAIGNFGTIVTSP